jgi:hypothetical protein
MLAEIARRRWFRGAGQEALRQLRADGGTRRASAQEPTRNGARRHGIKTRKADQDEVIAKLPDRGQRVEETGADLRELDLHVIAVNCAQGEVADCSRLRRAKQAYR